MTRRDFIVRLLTAPGWMVFVPNSLARGRAVDFERSRRGDHSVGFFTDHTQFVDQNVNSGGSNNRVPLRWVTPQTVSANKKG